MKINDNVYYLGNYYKIVEIGSVFIYLGNSFTTVRADKSLIQTATDEDINDHLCNKAKALEHEINFFKG